MAKLPNETIKSATKATEGLIKRAKTMLFPEKLLPKIPGKLLSKISTVSELGKLESAAFKNAKKIDFGVIKKPLESTALKELQDKMAFIDKGALKAKIAKETRTAKLTAGETRIMEHPLGPDTTHITEARLTQADMAKFNAAAPPFESQATPFHAEPIPHMGHVGVEHPALTQLVERVKLKPGGSEQHGITEARPAKVRKTSITEADLAKFNEAAQPFESQATPFHAEPIPHMGHVGVEHPALTQLVERVKLKPGGSEQHGITERGGASNKGLNSTSGPASNEGPAGMSQKQIRENSTTSYWRELVKQSFNPSGPGRK